MWTETLDRRRILTSAFNGIGALALDPNDPNGNTIYVGTGETNQPNNSGAGICTAGINAPVNDR